MMRLQKLTQNYIFCQLTFLVTLICVLIIFQACQVYKPVPCIKQGVAYGTIEGSFRGQWWDYYASGLSYSRGGCWSEAETMFKHALQLNPHDELMAETYGMNHRDYFPHREVGIVYYFLNNYQQAFHELQKSIEDEKSGRAVFYLNCVKRAIIKKADNDKSAPVIQFSKIKQGLTVDNYRWLLSGKIKDDHYIEKVYINDQPIDIESFEPEYHLNQLISLKPGNNILSIKAIDVAGNETTEKVQIMLDIQGPAICLAPFKVKNDRKIDIKGFITDASGIKSIEIVLNNRSIPVELSKGTTVVSIDKTVSSLSIIEKVQINAIDLAGNSSSMKWDNTQILQSQTRNLYALLDNDIYLSQTKKLKERIRLEDWDDEQDVVVDNLYLKLNVQSFEKTVQTIHVYHNNQLILFNNLFYYNDKSNIYFSEMQLHFTEEKNEVQVVVNKGKKESFDKTFKFYFKKEDIQKYTRMPVSIIPDEFQKYDAHIQNSFSEYLFMTNRFNIIDAKSSKDVEKLREKRCTDDIAVCKKKGIRQAPFWKIQWMMKEFEQSKPVKKLESDNKNIDLKSLISSVSSSPKKQSDMLVSLEFILKIISTENDQLIYTNHFYLESIDKAFMIKSLCQSAAMKIYNDLPAGQGTIIDIDPDEQDIFVSVGDLYPLVKTGMHLVVYKIINRPKCQIPKYIAEAVIYDKQQDFLMASLRDKNRFSQIKPKIHMVIIR